MIRVSAIIPTYGMPDYLEKAIISVKKQTISEWELIVVDDNNPDTLARKKTEELLNCFAGDDRIKYIQHTCNKNGAAARNTGISIASGQYIAFLDSDDEYLPQRFEKCCAALDSAGDTIGGVYTGCEMRKGGRTVKIVSDIKAGNFLVESLACTFVFCTGSNLFLKKQIVDELGGFDETFLRHQDYEFVVRFFEKYDWAAIREPLVIKNNENINVPAVDKLEGIKRQYLDKYSDIINTLSTEQQNYIYHSHNVQLAEHAMRVGQYQLAKKFYMEAINSYQLTSREIIRKYGFYLKNVFQKRIIIK